MDRKWIPSIVLAIALAGVGVWGYGQYLKNREYAIFMDNLYQKSFYELVGHVGNIENKLSKFMVSGDRNWHMMLLSDVWRHSAAAGEDLGELPLGHLTLRETSKFMNQRTLVSFNQQARRQSGQYAFRRRQKEHKNFAITSASDGRTFS